jgi:hypothetical protein
MCIYETENFEKPNNSFEQLILMHPTLVLCEISIVECSYRCVNIKYYHRHN